MDDVISALLVGGDGLLTRTDAMRHGIHDTALRRALRAGELVRVAPGHYRAPTSYDHPEDEHAARARAVAARIESSAISHYSALACHRLPTYGCDLTTVHLATSNPHGRWRRPGLTVHLAPKTVTTSGLLPVPVALAQTGTVAGPVAFIVSGDAAIHRGLATVAEISAAVSLLRRTPGIAAVRAATMHLDGRSESVGESVARYLIALLGWTVTAQFWVQTAGQRYRADLRIAGERVLVEFDGLGKYADRTALIAEKRREADLRATGWEVVRLVWSDLDDPARIARLVGSAVRRARHLARVPA